MNVLTIYAHPNPKSFCHAVLERFTQGLKDAGHANELIDLYAIGFDPVLRMRDYVNWLPDENAPDVVERVVREQVFARDAPWLQRWYARWRFRGKSPLTILNVLRSRGPKDIQVQQQQVANADVLVFIAPVWFVGFPAILKGWIERVFTLGFAFSLTSAGWKGDISGRIPRLRHAKALIINTTIFNEQAYTDGLANAMRRLIDEFSLHYPGVRAVQHEYFYAVHKEDHAMLQAYLDRAYRLGRDLAA